MITGLEALEKIDRQCVSLPLEYIPSINAVGRVLAGDIYAKEDLPPFDNSAMDGYAVRAVDVATASKENPLALSIQSHISAGKQAKDPLRQGETMKIMTGAPLPEGADTVAIKEGTEAQNGTHVRILYAPKSGDHLRRRGEDVRKGDLILKTGAVIRPYEVALLAAQGISVIPVIQKPKVAVIVTGDELVEGSEPLSPGQIRNSNGPALVSALTRWGGEVVYQGMARDNEKDLKEKLKEGFLKANIVLITGGVSVGDFDFTRPVLTECGVDEIFWKVAIKPGKPLFFGVLKNQYIFGLPGNPISALVCLEEFVRPALEKMRGIRFQHPSYHLKGTALNDYSLPEDRQQYLFCQAEQKKGEFCLHIIRPQGSAMLGMACQANALALSQEGARRVQKGDSLSFRWLK